MIELWPCRANAATGHRIDGEPYTPPRYKLRAAPLFVPAKIIEFVVVSVISMRLR